MILQVTLMQFLKTVLLKAKKICDIENINNMQINLSVAIKKLKNNEKNVGHRIFRRKNLLKDKNGGPSWRYFFVHLMKRV